MALVYTTVSAISRRMRGRVDVGGLSLPFQPVSADDALIDQIGAQVEARVDAQLRSVYKLPLSGSHPHLTGIVEKLICGEILAIHSMGDEQVVSSDEGRVSSDRSYAGYLIRSANRELEAIVQGVTPLDGETLSTGDTSPPANSRNLTLSRKRTTGAAESISW